MKGSVDTSVDRNASIVGNIRILSLFSQSRHAVMVSKKPGLGKGLVRTIQHGQHAYVLPATSKERDIDKRLHSTRSYTTLSARSFDLVPLLSIPGRPSFDFGARRDGTTFNDFFPPPLPPSPAPHPISGRTIYAYSSGGILQQGSALSSDLTIPDIPEQTITSSAAYTSRYIFRTGSCGLAKDRPTMPPRKPSSRATPPPRPRSFPILDISPPAIYSSISVGEDAYFARPDGMCVADGVGGWARSGRGGADAGKWSRLLTHFCEAEVRRWWDGKEEYVEDLLADQTWDKFWPGNTRYKVRLKADDAAGLPQGLRRRKLDPVEIMQKGFEKCLSCFLKEVSLPWAS